MGAARSIWCGITVGLCVLVAKLYAASQYAPVRIRPDGSEGVRCGTGAMGAAFLAIVVGVLAMIALLIFVTRKRA